MSSLSKTIEAVRTKIEAQKAKSLSEESTKAALINPILSVLGWDVADLDEVLCEYRYKSNANPVDYALLIDGTPAVLVEAKALWKNLADAEHQIMGYAGTVGVAPWFVVTNGDEYRIYNTTVAVPIAEKLFRSVRLTDPHCPAEETLLLLSKDQINNIDDQWKRHFADSRVRAAINKLFSPPPNRLLTGFVNKELRGKGMSLSHGQIKESLGRLVGSFERLVDRAAVEATNAKPKGGTFVGAAPNAPGAVADKKLSATDAAAVALAKSKVSGQSRPTVGDGQYSEFWEPIRRDGLFKGKPVPLNGDAWIQKTIRGINVSLELRNHACSVALQLYGEDRAARRKKVLSLFPAAKYSYETSESGQCAFVRFPVIDKGRNDREQWPEIREKLTKLGVDIYNKIAGSEV